MVWWVQEFCVYPPLETVHLFFDPPLVVLAPLEVYQVCYGELELRLTVVLDI